MNSQQLAREGAWIVAGVMAVCIVMLGIEAVVHDGQLAQVVTSQLIGVVQWAIPVLGGLVAVGQVAGIYVAKGQNQNQAPNQGAATGSGGGSPAAGSPPGVPAVVAATAGTLTTPAQVILGDVAGGQAGS